MWGGGVEVLQGVERHGRGALLAGLTHASTNEPCARGAAFASTAFPCTPDGQVFPRAGLVRRTLTWPSGANSPALARQK